jgi:DNA-binding NtrC family response regulator
VEREKPSIVILSLTTSDVNEIKVLRQIKKMDENIEVVIITSYGTMKVARAAMELGAYDYVTKPFEDNYIKALITIALSPVPDELLQLASK